MEKIIIDPKSNSEFDFLTKFLNENNIRYQTVEEQATQKKTDAKRRLVDFLDNTPKYDISMDEITDMIEKVRSEKYAKRNQDHS